MADRELLELAARAAGVEGVYDEDLGGIVMVDCECTPSIWRPHTDGGDALRLAADLGLLIKPGKHKGDGCTVDTQRDGVPGCTAFYEDKYEQMCRAIVRAAAEIGRSME